MAIIFLFLFITIVFLLIFGALHGRKHISSEYLNYERTIEEKKATPPKITQHSIPSKLPPKIYSESHFFQKRSHCARISSAQRMLQWLRSISLTSESELPIVLGSLRKLDPFVFEELILTCCAERGWQIQRNHKYTGDGGIDGRVWIEGKLFLIQAKRYKQLIKVTHIDSFYNVIQEKRAVGGIFVHTGRTSILSQESICNAEGTIILLSGQQLVNFVLGKAVPLKYLTPFS